MSPTALAALARAAQDTVAHSEAGGPTAGTTPVRMFGSTAAVNYQLINAEVRRRDGRRAVPAPGQDVLDVLMGLPVGLPVPADSLTDRERRLLGRAPQGAVDRDGEHVVRRAVAPLTARFAVVTARDWKIGLKRADRFAPFCERAVLLPALPQDADDLFVRASFSGCGVCVFSGKQLDMVVEPRRYVRRRHTPAQWWFAEEVFAQLSESEPASSMT
ncbi:hypothetical protein FHX81_5460 [Saccharothrix saharensis]|uniref:Uncharacterized protein n=1 Tax=Saccharothrix saharensis TaxID=571190 RepID=A0A543JJL1_9PSEU|nr:hypothetical protein [Saccharothrix saharensis]TQM83047.1 hypothetical protein FHX81_5460 [Saccharothrix saharensis]